MSRTAANGWSDTSSRGDAGSGAGDAGAIFWQLAAMARTGAARLRPLLILFAINWATTAVLSGRYFFVAPAATQASMAACLLAAWARARD